MTTGEARRALTARLASAGREPAGLDARLLIEAATGLDHATVLRDSHLPMGEPASAALSHMAGRRLRGEPTSRILGTREFCGLSLQVRRDVLDPREDTEAVVRLSRDLCRSPPMRIADLGTGSGALLCASLASFEDACGIGVDLSPSACAAARANAQATGVAARALIVRGAWTAALKGPFDLIVSNPPYIARNELPHLPVEVRDHDPPLALDGGCDGLDAYRAILADIRRIASADALVVLEIGAGQGRDVEGLLRHQGLVPCGSERDGGRVERAIAARLA